MSNPTDTIEPTPAPTPETPTPTPAPVAHAPAARPKKRALGRWIFLGVIVAAGGVLVVVRGPGQAQADLKELWKQSYHFVAGAERNLPPTMEKPKPPTKFNGTITLKEDQYKALGINLADVLEQTKPLYLELPGTTDYDQNTLAKVRPLFDARVKQVFKSTGQMVKKGDPLVELDSTELAAAKADYRQKYATWVHDKTLKENRRTLAIAGNINAVVWVDTVLAELKSRVDYLNARDKLRVSGIPLADLTRLEINVSDDPKAKDPNADKGSDKDLGEMAKLVLLSPIDGMIVDRDVVSGNFYDDQAVVMTISPMDKLWVWGNVYEKDQGEVHLGQTWEIQFPYLKLPPVKGQVEQISSKLDTSTRTLKIRATIPNPSKELKAEMLVKAVLQIKEIKGQTVIPRNAMAVINGEYCCFVQNKNNPLQFTRKMIDIVQENHDFVIVKSGITAGEKVVTNGSLILSQMYEDQSTVDTGMPTQ